VKSEQQQAAGLVFRTRRFVNMATNPAHQRDPRTPH
jgi:hypothetical protein